MFTQQFWSQTLERAVKTFAQSLIAVLGVGSVGLLDAPWTIALSAAGMATMLSVLTSVASEPLGERGTPNALPVAERSQPEARTATEA